MRNDVSSNVKNRMVEPSSSESDGEDAVQIQESIDHEFINSIFEKVNDGNNKTLPSLRPPSMKKFTNDLKVTPEFQKHIAKHLDVILKRQIKEDSGAHKTGKINSDKVTHGIRLFSNSKVRIRSSDLEADASHKNNSRPKKKARLTNSIKLSSSDESADELERLSSAAVSPEWVLLKEGAYGKCEKGEVMRLIDSGSGYLVVRPDDPRNEQQTKRLY